MFSYKILAIFVAVFALLSPLQAEARKPFSGFKKPRPAQVQRVPNSAPSPVASTQPQQPGLGRMAVEGVVLGAAVGAGATAGSMAARDIYNGVVGKKVECVKAPDGTITCPEK